MNSDNEDSKVFVNKDHARLANSHHNPSVRSRQLISIPRPSRAVRLLFILGLAVALWVVIILAGVAVVTYLA